MDWDPEAPPTSEIDDVEFANGLLDYTEQSYCIDTNGVYATGFSDGGGLTHLLACDVKVLARLRAHPVAFYKDSALKQPLFRKHSLSSGRIDLTKTRDE